MRFLTPILVLFMIILCVFAWYICTYRQQFDVVLSDKPHPSLDSVTNRYRFESLDLRSKKTEEPDGVHATLTIKCINGMNIPNDDDQMLALAKTIATLIKSALKDPDQFESYNVLFLQKTTDGDKTTSSYVGHEFKAIEIN